MGIEVNNTATSPEPEVVLDNLPLSGTTNFQVPTGYSGLAFTLYGVNRSANGVVERILQHQLYVTVNTNPVTAFTVQAAYQPYDTGFMIWRADTGEVYAFFNSGSFGVYPESYYASLMETIDNVTTPAGRVRPIRGFGRVWWGNYPDFSYSLGWATAPEEGYTMNIQTLVDGSTSFALPTGRVLKWYRGLWVWNPV